MSIPDDSEPYVLKEIQHILSCKEVDRLQFGCYAFNNKLSIKENQMYNEKSLETNLFTGNVYVWNSIFRKSYIDAHKIKFINELYTSEDSIFMLDFNLCAPQVEIVDKVFYLHRWHASSLCSTNDPVIKNKKFLSHIQVARSLNARYEVLSKQKVVDITEVANLLMSNLWGALFIAANSSNKEIS